MSRHHMTADGPVPFTAQEETEFDARQSAYDDAYPMFKWKEAMQASDSALLSRTMKDILDGMPNKLSVAKITLDRLQAKKDLRATKP